MVIAIYSRKSVWSDSGDSTKNQIHICRQHIERLYHGKQYTILIYEDEGYTGANIERPDFQRLMKDIRAKKVNVLVCYRLDRVSRTVLDFSSIFQLLQSFNVEFISVKENVDTSTPMGRAMMYMSSVFAQMERETTAERVQDNMVELFKTGRWTGGKAPLGYDRKRVEYTDPSGKNKFYTKLVVNEKWAEMVRFIYDKYLELGTLSQLEKYFINNDISTPGGKLFTSTPLYQILTNPNYAPATLETYDYYKQKGSTILIEKEKFDGQQSLVSYRRTAGGRNKKHIKNDPSKWLLAIGMHEPIIDIETFLKVQETFGRSKAFKERKYEIGLLRGIIRCNSCGQQLRTKRKIDMYGIYDHYICPKRERNNKLCDAGHIRLNEIDKTLLNTLKSIQSEKETIYGYLENHAALNDVKSIEVQKGDVQKKITKTKDRIRNLTRSLQENMESPAAKYIIQEVEEQDRALNELNHGLADIIDRQNTVNNTMLSAETVYGKIQSLLSSFDNLCYKDKNSTLKSFIRACTWNPETQKLGIEFF